MSVIPPYSVPHPAPQQRPQQMGGTLIRRWISFLKANQARPQLGSQILCAVSGGPDSTALATLIKLYGHRLGEAAGIVHFNHRWRGERSDRDEERVRALAEALRLPIWVGYGSGRSQEESPEAAARKERRDFFATVLRDFPAGTRVWTAHHQDDLAETLLWRIMTGSSDTHGEGIRVVTDLEVRPCLSTRKYELEAFLREENLTWSEDETNREGNLLRARIRRELAPVLDTLFPRWRNHLAQQAMARQKNPQLDSLKSSLLDLISHQGIRVRRAHLNALSAESLHGRSQSVDLPDGWKLTHELNSNTGRGRWILE